MFSIIIPTCNRHELLGKCLEMLCTGNLQSSTMTFEIVVTDDSNNDFTKDFLAAQYQSIKWVKGPKRGPAANRNNGASYATGDWLVFIDDDCLPQRELLNAYLDVITKNDTILVLEGRTLADGLRKRFDEQSPINTNGNNLWSCNFAIKRSFFDLLLGFDELFPYASMEDVDFYTRVKLNREKAFFVPKALVIHPWRQVSAVQYLKINLKSHKLFLIKYGINKEPAYRWDRIKIWMGGVYYDFKDLLLYSAKGWQLYVAKVIMNFLLIFI